MADTLLLVDDEENILSALTRLFRRDGYRVLRAKGGSEGLRVLADEDVTVIISDQRMPEMTGVDFLSQVKERYPETLRIMLSGYSDLQSVTDAINKGAIFKFLTKPWDDDLLRANVRDAFDFYHLRRDKERLSQQLQQVNEQLSVFNRDLADRVAEKTHELTISLKSLATAQAVFDNLPCAVLGIADDDMVVVANQRAHSGLCASGTGLVGQEAHEVLIPALMESFEQLKWQGGGQMPRFNPERPSGCCICVPLNDSATEVRGWILIVWEEELRRIERQ